VEPAGQGPVELLGRAELVPVTVRADGGEARQALAVGAELHAAEELDRALSGWFHTAVAPHAEAMTDLNLLAFALTRAHRPAEAALVLRRVGRHMTRHPWDLLPEPERAFLYWRDGAAG
jgi:hypothetical protein